MSDNGETSFKCVRFSDNPASSVVRQLFMFVWDFQIKLKWYGYCKPFRNVITQDPR